MNKSQMKRTGVGGSGPDVNLILEAGAQWHLACRADRSGSSACAAGGGPGKGMVTGMEEVTRGTASCNQRTNTLSTKAVPLRGAGRASGLGTSTEERERPRLTLGDISARATI